MSKLELNLVASDGLSAPLKQAAKSVREAYDNLDKLSGMIDTVDSQDFDGLAGESSTAKKALDTLDASAEATGKSIEGLSTASSLGAKAVQALGSVATATGTGLKALGSGVESMGKLTRSLGTGLEGVGKAVQGAGKGITSLGSAVDSVGQSISKIGTIGAGAVTALTGIGVAATKTALDFVQLYESSNIVFTKMLGSQEAADDMYNSILDIATASTFSQESFLDAAKGLVGVGVSASNTATYLQAITDAVAGFGGDSSKIEQIAQAFRKVSTNGRISMMEVNQLADAGINVMTILANSYGKTTEEMRDMISYHPELLGGAEVLNVLAEGIENGTQGVAGMTQAMAGMAKTLKGSSLTGQFDSLHSSIRNFSRSLVGLDNSKKKDSESQEEYNARMELYHRRLGQITAALSKINEIIPATAKLFSGITDGIGGMLDKLIGSDPVFDEATGTWQNAGGVLSGLAQKIKEMPPVTLPGLSEIPDQLASVIPGFDNILERMRELDISDRLKTGLERFGGFIDKVEKKLSGFSERLSKSKNPLVAMLGSGLSMLTSGLEGLSSMIKSIVDGDIGGTFSGIGDWFKNLDPGQISMVTGIILKLVAMSPLLLVFGKSISLISKPIKLLGSAVTGIGGLITTAGGAIKKAGDMAIGAGKLFGKAGDHFKGLGKVIKDTDFKIPGLSGLADQFKDGATKAGNALSTAFRPGIDKAVSMFDSMKYTINSKIAGIGKEAIVLSGPTVTPASTGFFSSLTSGFSGFTTALPGVLSGIGQMGAAFLAATPIIAGVAAVIGAVTIALGLLNKEGQGAATVTSFFDGLAATIGGIKDTVVGKISEISNAIVEQGPLLAERGVELIEAIISGIVTSGGALVDAGVSILGALGMGLINAAPTLVSAGLDAVGSLITWLQGQAVEWGMMALDWIISLGQGLADNAPLIMQRGAETVAALFNGIATNLPMIIEGGIQALTSFGTGILQHLPQIIEVALQIIGSLASGIISNLPVILEAGFSLIVSLAGAIIGGVGELVKAAFTLMYELGKSVADNKWQILGAMANVLIDLGKSVADTAIGIGKSLISGICEGIENAKNWVINKWNNLISSLTSGVSWLFGGGENTVNVTGYASGTEAATKGVHLVGENGPELVEFKGGETVHNANETQRILNNNTINNYTQAGTTILQQPAQLEPVANNNNNTTVNSGDIHIDNSGWVINGGKELQEKAQDVLEQITNAVKQQRMATANGVHI